MIAGVLPSGGRNWADVGGDQRGDLRGRAWRVSRRGWRGLEPQAA